MAKKRTRRGYLRADAKRFPSGIKKLAEYVSYQEARAAAIRKTGMTGKNWNKNPNVAYYFAIANKPCASHIGGRGGGVSRVNEYGKQNT